MVCFALGRLDILYIKIISRSLSSDAEYYLKLKMHLIPCGSYQPHYLGQPGSTVPQHVALPDSSEATQQRNSNQTSQANGVLCRGSGVQKQRQGRNFMARDWTVEEDNTIVALRSKGLAWTAISKMLPGRTYFACRLRFQNCLSRPYQRNGGRQTPVAGHYDRCLSQTQI